ncbi:hypothetical protein CHELA1G11_20871 [Hyphomicrobiales bacterium]|nr:hypothetical protein CHELA1G11_20871 [Hyphomicrobiales bacterium]CAH1692361.1 hypothetical protein CHELA1G2_21188 [Hyphomicrobiales bacterium]
MQEYALSGRRLIKRRIRPVIGFKSFSSAAITLAGNAMIPDDAQATGPLRLQSGSDAKRTVRGDRRLKTVITRLRSGPK